MDWLTVYASGIDSYQPLTFNPPMANSHIFLWFQKDAVKAAKFYGSIFKDSKVTDSSSMSASFRLGKQSFILFNGGPHYKLSPATSVLVEVKTQKEIDTYWKKLLKGGGTELRCGWLTDRFGLSWQIIPTILPDLLGASDRKKAGRAMDAMMKMRKLDIKKLKDAFEGKS